MRQYRTLLRIYIKRASAYLLHFTNTKKPPNIQWLSCTRKLNYDNGLMFNLVLEAAFAFPEYLSNSI